MRIPFISAQQSTLSLIAVAIPKALTSPIVINLIHSFFEWSIWYILYSNKFAKSSHFTLFISRHDRTTFVFMQVWQKVINMAEEYHGIFGSLGIRCAANSTPDINTPALCAILGTTNNRSYIPF
jgi:hypothetical protein